MDNVQDKNPYRIPWIENTMGIMDGWIRRACFLGGVCKMQSELTYMIRALVRNPEICTDLIFKKCPACGAQYIIWDEKKQQCFKCGFKLQKYIQKRKPNLIRWLNLTISVFIRLEEKVLKKIQLNEMRSVLTDGTVWLWFCTPRPARTLDTKLPVCPFEGLLEQIL